MYNIYMLNIRKYVIICMYIFYIVLDNPLLESM